MSWRIGRWLSMLPRVLTSWATASSIREWLLSSSRGVRSTRWHGKIKLKYGRLANREIQCREEGIRKKGEECVYAYDLRRWLHALAQSVAEATLFVDDMIELRLLIFLSNPNTKQNISISIFIQIEEYIATLTQREHFSSENGYRYFLLPAASCLTVLVTTSYLKEIILIISRRGKRGPGKNSWLRGGKWNYSSISKGREQFTKGFPSSHFTNSRIVQFCNQLCNWYVTWPRAWYQKKDLVRSWPWLLNPTFYIGHAFSHSLPSSQPFPILKPNL